MEVNCSIRASYGRSLVGSTSRKVVRSIRSKKYSILAGMNNRGIIFHRTLSASFNGKRYAKFIRELLFYFDQTNTKNMIIIMDNCRIHKVNGN